MKKLILIPFLLLFLTGCSVDYTIEIDDNMLNETIKLNTLGITTEKTIELEDFLYNGAVAVSAVQLEIPYYNVTKYNNYYEMNYNYKKGEVELSTLFNTCFNNYKTEETDNYYMFVMSGGFNCMYDNEEINVTLKTNNKVSKHNSENYDILSGEYKWQINQFNYKKMDIRFVVIKDSASDTEIKASSFVKNILIIISIIFVILGGIVIVKKIFDIINKVNE